MFLFNCIRVSSVFVPCHHVRAARDFSVRFIPTCISSFLHNSSLRRICISLKFEVPGLHCSNKRNGGRRSWPCMFAFDPALLLIYLLYKNPVTKRELNGCQQNILSLIEVTWPIYIFYLKKHFLGCLSTRWPSGCVPCWNDSAGKLSLCLLRCTETPSALLSIIRSFLWLWCGEM